MLQRGQMALSGSITIILLKLYETVKMQTFTQVSRLAMEPTIEHCRTPCNMDRPYEKLCHREPRGSLVDHLLLLYAKIEPLTRHTIIPTHLPQLFLLQNVLPDKKYAL